MSGTRKLTGRNDQIVDTASFPENIYGSEISLSRKFKFNAKNVSHEETDTLLMWH